MAVELEKFIEGQLNSLPPDHSDRRHLEDLLVTTKSYIERAGRGVAAFTSAEQAVKEYRCQPHTPELVTMFHRTIWQERGKLVRQTYEVSPCPYTQEELADLEQQGKRVGYLPAELATQQSRHILGKMFPQMRSLIIEKGNYSVPSVTKNKNSFGWFDYEAAIDAPYFNAPAEGLTEEGRVLLSLNQYIVAGQDSKLLTGQYLDEKGTLTSLDFCDGGHVVKARFNRDGGLDVDWGLGSYSRCLDFCGRSSGVKRT